jgi:hypothetical protein
VQPWASVLLLSSWGCRHAPLCFWDRVLLTFYPSWAQTLILLSLPPK